MRRVWAVPRRAQAWHQPSNIAPGMRVETREPFGSHVRTSIDPDQAAGDVRA
jgi:hypothetical protein